MWETQICIADEKSLYTKTIEIHFKPLTYTAVTFQKKVGEEGENKDFFFSLVIILGIHYIFSFMHMGQLWRFKITKTN